MDTLSRVVRWLNEKSQIQALHRTQPGLPLNKGRAGTMTHDYIGNGTTTLIAAMSIVDGAVIGRNVHRHRHQEFVCLLNGIGDKGPPAKILDTYAARKQPKVLQALDLRSALVARSSPNVDLFLQRGPIVDMPVEAPSAQNADFDLDRGCHCRCADTRSRSAPRSYVDMTRLFRRLNSDRSNFVGTLLTRNSCLKVVFPAEDNGDVHGFVIAGSIQGSCQLCSFRRHGPALCADLTKDYWLPSC